MHLIKWMGLTNENESPNPGRSFGLGLGSLTEGFYSSHSTPFFCLTARTKEPNEIQEPKKRLKTAAATKQVQSQRYFKRPAQSSHQERRPDRAKPKTGSRINFYFLKLNQKITTETE